MNRLLKDKNFTALSAVFLLEMLVTAVLFVMFFIPSKSYSIQPGESIRLPLGHYYLTCEYEIESGINTVNYLYIQNSDGSVKGIAQVENYLGENNDSLTTEFWINGHSRDITISVRQIGENEESPSAHIAACTITSTKYICAIMFAVMSMLLALTFVYSQIKNKKIVISRDDVKKLCIFAVVFLISCIPLLSKKLLVGWDLEIHLVRIEGIMQGYKAGQLPVRVEPAFNGGYGYAFSTYYGGLFYNIAAIARLIGFSIQGAYKIYVVVINLATILISYYCFKLMFENDRTAMYGSILYSLSLYRLFDLYQRGAVGEYTAITFLPLVAAGLWKIYTASPEEEGYGRLWILPVLGYTGIIQAHILSTEISGLFTVIICLVLFKKTFRKKTFIVLLKIVLFTIVLNLWFLYPFIENYMFEDTIISGKLLQGQELSNNVSIRAMFKYNFGKPESWYNILEAGSGPALLIIAVLIVYGMVTNTLEKQDKNRLFFVAVFAAIATIICTNRFPWNAIIEKLNPEYIDSHALSKIAEVVRNCILNIQYAFRFMIISCLLVTVTACILYNRKDRVIKYAGYAIVFIMLFQAIYSGVSFIINGRYEKYLSINDNNVGFSSSIGNMEYIPLTADGRMPYLEQFYDVHYCFTTNSEVTEYHKQYTNIYAHVVADKENVGIVEFPLLYYRGYKIVDVNTGKKFQPFKIGECARLGIITEPDYEGDIKVYYAGENMWHVMDVISLLAFIGLIAYIVVSKTAVYAKKRASKTLPK